MIRTLSHGLKLIPPGYRGKALRIGVMVTVASVLDLVSIVSFFPILFVIAGEGSSGRLTWLTMVMADVGIVTVPQFVTVLSVFAVTMILLKTWAVMRINRIKANFAYSTASVIANQLMRAHLSRRLIEFASLDHAHELNRISNLPLIFANNIIIPLGTILAETIVTCVLLTIVAVYQINVFLFLLVLVLPLALVLYSRKCQAERSGEKIKRVYPNLLKSSLQAIEGFYEILAFGRERFFEERFRSNVDQTSKTMAEDHVIHGSVARTTELVAAVAVGLLIVLTAWLSPENLVITLGLYAAIFFRIIPSINRIASSVVQMNAHTYAVDELTHQLRTKIATRWTDRVEIPLLDKFELQNICFEYVLGRPVLQNLNLVLHKGERVIIHGRSGNGKSTLLYLLLNFITPSSGKIRIDNRELYGQEKWRLRADYVSQNPYLLDASILENIAFGEDRSQIQVKKVEAIVRELDLMAWVETLPQGLETVIGEKGVRVSGGQRQRLAIGRALYCDSEILLLDEVTNQLDRETEAEIAKIFARPAFEGKTIVLISHHPETWKNFGTLYELREGQLQKTSPTAQSAF